MDSKAPPVKSFLKHPPLRCLRGSDQPCDTAPNRPLPFCHFLRQGRALLGSRVLEQTDRGEKRSDCVASQAPKCGHRDLLIRTKGEAH
eukprot:scaffold29_cov251-Pinguiococcus_pyrenoidosus.AAC.28